MAEFNCSQLNIPEDAVCMEHPEEMLKPWKTNPMFFEIIVVHVATFVFGLCGNVLVVAVLTGDGKARTATNSFLVSLAVGDLLMLCVYGPLETYSHFVLDWDESGAVCKAAMFAEFLSATSSVLNLLAVTVERFLVIVFPMKSRTFCTISNTLKAIALVWLLSVFLASPIIPATGTYRIIFANNSTRLALNYCNHSVDSPAFAVYQFLIIFLVPGAIMIVCYSFVIRELWESTRKMDALTNGIRSSPWSRSESRKSVRHQDGGEQEQRKRCVIANKDEANAARKQVIKMLILVIVLFYLSWGPRLAMDVLQKLRMIPFTQASYLLRIIFNVATFFHGCINPFVYSFMSRNFRGCLARRLGVMGCGAASKCLEPGAQGRRNRKPAAADRKWESSSRGGAREGRRGDATTFASSSDVKATEVESVLLSDKSQC